MKTFGLVLLLGVILFLGYRRAETYGWPWQSQVEIVRADHSMRGRNSTTVYVDGEVRNRTKVAGTAEIECAILPGTATIAPKTVVTVELGPEAVAAFQASTNVRTKATGLRCKISDWNTGEAQESQWWDGVKNFFGRFVGDN